MGSITIKSGQTVQVAGEYKTNEGKIFLMLGQSVPFIDAKSENFVMEIPRKVCIQNKISNLEIASVAK